MCSVSIVASSLVCSAAAVTLFFSSSSCFRVLIVRNTDNPLSLMEYTSCLPSFFLTSPFVMRKSRLRLTEVHSIFVLYAIESIFNGLRANASRMLTYFSSFEEGIWVHP